MAGVALELDIIDCTRDRCSGFHVLAGVVPEVDLVDHGSGRYNFGGGSNGLWQWQV